MNKTVMDFEASIHAGNPKTTRVMILLTDGQSTDKEFVPATADYVRSKGIKTFAIGVWEANIDELRTIANGNGTDEGVFEVDDFSNLGSIVATLQGEIQTICSV
jgi:uncharacterized protein YegL